jgi:hypothetical protein
LNRNFRNFGNLPFLSGFRNFFISEIENLVSTCFIAKCHRVPCRRSRAPPYIFVAGSLPPSTPRSSQQHRSEYICAELEFHRHSSSLFRQRSTTSAWAWKLSRCVEVPPECHHGLEAEPSAMHHHRSSSLSPSLPSVVFFVFWSPFYTSGRPFHQPGTLQDVPRGPRRQAAAPKRATSSVASVVYGHPVVRRRRPNSDPSPLAIKIVRLRLLP